MKKQELKHREHGIKTGMQCGEREPNVTEDTIFTLEGRPVAMYFRNAPGEMGKALEYANREFRSKRVPKSEMRRSSGLKGGPEVRQYSTILGFVPPKPNMGRNYHTISSVHAKESAKAFISAMIFLAQESERLVEKHLPDIYETQKEQMDRVRPENKLHDLWTSSISNYNVAAAYHRDTANMENTVNVIFIKKQRATGGHLHVPDFDLCLAGEDGAMIVYPAWMSIHGVTPIHETTTDGYRNSLVLYPLKAALK